MVPSFDGISALAAVVSSEKNRDVKSSFNHGVLGQEQQKRGESRASTESWTSVLECGASGRRWLLEGVRPFDNVAVEKAALLKERHGRAKVLLSVSLPRALRRRAQCGPREPLGILLSSCLLF